MRHSKNARRTAMLVAVLLVPAVSAVATTKGYNQIVTPDIQPAGVLSMK